MSLLLDAGTCRTLRRVLLPRPKGVSAVMIREAPNWFLILTLYTIAATVLILVRDEIGTGNDPYLKVAGWIALVFAVYWSIRGAYESLQRRCVTRVGRHCE